VKKKEQHTIVVLMIELGTGVANKLTWMVAGVPPVEKGKYMGRGETLGKRSCGQGNGAGVQQGEKKIRARTCGCPRPFQLNIRPRRHASGRYTG
jgi:hypothetical protein